MKRIMLLILVLLWLMNVIYGYNFVIPHGMTDIRQDYRGITSISLVRDADYTSLTTLSLNGNSLNSSCLVTIVELYNLKNLDLGKNNIGGIDFTVFKSLNGLNRITLNHNNIDWFKNSIQHDMPSLVEIDLSSNKISEMDFQNFTFFNNLTTLKLHENKISKFINVAILLKLKQLELLSLEKNSFLCVNLRLIPMMSNFEVISTTNVKDKCTLWQTEKHKEICCYPSIEAQCQEEAFNNITKNVEELYKLGNENRFELYQFKQILTPEQVKVLFDGFIIRDHTSLVVISVFIINGVFFICTVIYFFKTKRVVEYQYEINL